jgi:hypothetical protein
LVFDNTWERGNFGNLTSGEEPDAEQDVYFIRVSWSIICQILGDTIWLGLIALLAWFFRKLIRNQPLPLHPR